MSDVATAKENNPEGATCSFCHKENDFADDCGWFFLHPDGSDAPGGYTCEACYRGEPGRKHVARYGLGER